MDEPGHSESDIRRSGEELIDESGRNPTQRALDEERPTDRPVDTSWSAEPPPGERPPERPTDAPWGGEPREDDPARGGVGP